MKRISLSFLTCIFYSNPCFKLKFKTSLLILLTGHILLLPAGSTFAQCSSSPTISGNVNPCLGSAGNSYYTQPGMTNYTWTVSSGGTITAGGTSTDNSVVVTWFGGGAKTISINYTDSNNCRPSTPSLINISVLAPTISGPSIACLQTANEYTIPPPHLDSVYFWSVSQGGQITNIIPNNPSPSISATVLWKSVGQQTVSVSNIYKNGCTPISPALKNVTVIAPTITGNYIVCTGTSGVVYSTEAGMTDYVWTISAGGIITSGGTSTDNTATVSWNTSGPQTISVNYKHSSECVPGVPTVRNVTVSYPTPTFLINRTKVCSGGTGITYQTQSGKSNYSWNISPGGTIIAGGTATSESATVIWNTSGPQTISINYTSNGCTAPSPTVLNIEVNPIASITGNSNVCFGLGANTYLTEPGMTNYSWTVSSGGGIVGSANLYMLQVAWTSTGNKTIQVSYTNPSGGCSTTSQFSVNVKSVSTPSLIGNGISCTGVENTYTTESGKSNYQWTFPNGTTVTGGGAPGDNYIKAVWDNGGSKNISVTTTDNNGCSKIVNKNVTVNPTTTSLTGNLYACPGSSNNVYTTETGMSNYQWNVSSGGTIASGGTTASNTASVTWSTPGSQTISVKYTDPNGCTINNPIQSNVKVEYPSPVISGNELACGGITYAYSTKTGMYNYNWVTSAGGEIISGNGSSSISVIWHSSGQNTISVSYAYPNSCTSPVTTLNVNVNVPSIAGKSAVCLGSVGNVYTTEPGMLNYVWSVTGGDITAGGNGLSSYAVVTWKTKGQQSISVGYTNSTLTCTASPTVKSINVSAPSISGNTNVCPGTSGNLYTTEAGMQNYLWKISSGGTITAGGQPNDNFATITWTSSGARTVQVLYTNPSGCTASTPTIKNVNVNAPAPSLSGISSGCIGPNYIFNTQPDMSNYTWTVSPDGNIIAGGTSSSNTIELAWVTTGTKTISVNYSHNGSCSSAAFVKSINISQVSTPAITGPAVVCQGAFNQFSTSQMPSMNYYDWSTSAGGTIVTTPQAYTMIIKWDVSGSNFVTFQARNTSTGCNSPITTKYVTVNPLPSPALSGPSTACSGSTGNLYQTESGMTNYIWTVSSGGTITGGGTSTSNNVTVTWNTTGAKTVSVKYTDTNGCGASSATVANVVVSNCSGFAGGRIESNTADETEISEDSGLSNAIDIYPNPADDEIVIEISEEPALRIPVIIYNQMGKEVGQSYFEKGDKQKVINTTGLSDGIILIQIETPKGVLRRKTMVLHRN